MNLKKILNFCNGSVLILLCILMADCCITGAGRVLMVGPFSLRMIIFALTLILSVPIIFTSFNKLIKNPFMWAVYGFILWIAIEAVIGIVNGNSHSLIITDLKGFAYFAILPVAICVLSDKKRIHTLMKVMMYSSTALAIITILHLIIYLYFKDTFNTLYLYELENNVSMFSAVSTQIPRLFFKSSAYLFVGITFATYFQIKEKKINLLYGAITGICLFCIVLTYTRSLFLAAALAAITLIVGVLISITKDKRALFLKHMIAAVVSLFVVLSVFAVVGKTDYLRYAITRTVITFENNEPDQQPSQPTSTSQSTSGTITTTQSPSVSGSSAPVTESTQPPSTTVPSTTVPSTSTQATTSPSDLYDQATKDSDNLRGTIIAELLKMIKRSPIIGNGLGAAIEWRESNEYFYLDLTAKTGIIGFILYLLPAALILIKTIRNRKKSLDKVLLTTVWFSPLVGFMAFSFFNPYMNASLGILYYCCVMGSDSANT